MLLQVKASQGNKNVLEEYGIPYFETDKGLSVEFSKEDPVGSFARFVGETEHHIFSYSPSAGLVVVFQKESINGLKPGDIVQRKGTIEGQPLLVVSISPPDPERGFPWEWVDVRGPIGSYGFYAHELEIFNRNLSVGEMQLLQHLGH